MPREYTPRIPQVCRHCGVTFLALPSAIARGGGKFCGRACYRAASAPGDAAARTCTRCGETKPIEEYERRGAYRVHFCRECLNKQVRERYASDPDFAAERKDKAWRTRQLHPEQKKAWIAVDIAIRAGRLTPQPCWCGDVETDAHHHRGYAPEHALDVVWLCRRHHALAHQPSQPSEQL